MKAIKLRTEYLKNPLGIDIKEPCLMWKCEGGVTQNAYQIVCVDDENHVLWDSGKVNGNTMRVIYSGEKTKQS